MDITSVGFGAWALGGGGWAASWGSQEDQDSIAAIRYAVEQGVNWVDTAAVYGYGHSEEVVGRALRDIPDGERPYVFTKCGMIWDSSDPMKFPEQIGRPDSIRREVEDSLRRLGVERIDLYQMHWPPQDGTPIEDYWGTMLQLAQEGKIRAAGLSNHGVEQLKTAEKVGHVASLQPQFSAINRSTADEIAWCAEVSTGVIVYSPMGSGLLTGKFSRERVANLDSDDWRRSSPDFTTNLDANLAVAETMRGIAERRDVPVPSVAVAWALAWRGVTGAIVGARRPDQVDGWLPAANMQLTNGELDEIAKSIADAGAGEGPTRP
jgi:aryl-alcohol dehydrogenase-like predicted oxidoreductase